jgi:hypothetical protein
MHESAWSVDGLGTKHYIEALGVGDVFCLGVADASEGNNGEERFVQHFGVASHELSGR